jgi:hypothetical protein
MEDKQRLSRDKFRRLAVLEIDPDTILGNGKDSENIEYLLGAVRAADEIFWRQVVPGFDLQALLEQAKGDNELKEMLLFNYGPYDRLNDDAPLLPVPRKFPGVGFYPADLTQAEFVDYLRREKASKDNLESPYTVIRRTNAHLIGIPFHEAYKDFVTRLSHLLTKAAALEPHAAFREFLAQRAKDLLTDDFHASDILWVNLTDNPIDLVVGPYEVYQDGLLGVKASYEALLLKRNSEDSAKVQHFQQELPKMCASLERQVGCPLAVDGQRVRISVADLVYAGGDAHAGIPAIAFTLPNDERTIEEVGTRQIILRNVLEAKFQFVGWEILNRVLQEPPAEKRSAFQSFFTFTLLHEIAHSIGHHLIIKEGEATTVNRSLKQHYSALEEAKADILAACLALNTVEAFDVQTFLQTYVGGLLRPIRFGFADAHGVSNTIQFNYLLRAGAIVVSAATGRISVEETRIAKALCKLAAEILDIQKSGNFDAAQSLIDNYRVIGPELESLLQRIEDLPVDIRIRFRNDPSGSFAQHHRFGSVDSQLSRLPELVQP